MSAIVKLSDDYFYVDLKISNNTSVSLQENIHGGCIKKIYTLLRMKVEDRQDQNHSPNGHVYIFIFRQQ